MSDSLKNRTPVMNPFVLAVNLRPKFTALVSLASNAPAGVVFGQIEHGHDAGGAVVKLHENGALIGTPDVFCAPDTVAVYVAFAVNAAPGVNVATVFPVPKLTAPPTNAPVGSANVNDTELGNTACENVADGAVDTGLLDEPAGRVARLTAGGWAVPVVAKITPALGDTPDTTGGGGGPAVWV